MTMTAWRETTMGDLLDVKHGFAFLGEYFAEAGTHVVLTPGNFNERGGFRSKDEKAKWYTGPIPPDYVLRRGDVLIAMTEQGEGLLGASAVVPADNLYLHNQRLGLVRVREGVDLGFVYHLFNSPHVRQQIRATASGAKVRHTSPSRVAEVRVRVPSDVREQRRIAGILSAYDNLIENCERRIRVLDEMARALYREWFVNFRYPGHENVPLVNSSLGPIPRGWVVAALGVLTSKIGSGATPRGGKEAYCSEGIALIRSLNIYDDRFQFDDLAFIDDDQASQLANVTVERFDVLLNITGASVARCAMVPSYILPARVNQHVAIVRADPSRVDPHFLLDSINSAQRKAQLLALAQGGATREALTKETISKFEIVVAPSDLLRRYGELARTSSAEREALRRQADNLQRTRDLLLPRLLSGQLFFQDAA